MIRKIGVLTSGGDSPGMNAAIRAVTRSALCNGIEVVGIRNGFLGLVNGEYVPFDRNSVSDIVERGGTILGSARLPEFRDPKVVEAGVEKLKGFGIDALVVIGGDGTYKGGNSLTQRGVNCIGIPGTIDNDIPGTNFTIGFDTALDTVTSCIDKLKDTSSSHHRCSVVEVMGNKCGDLAVYSAIACGAEVVITPETGYDEEDVLDKLKYLDSIGKNHAIVVVTEKMVDVNSFANKISEYTTYSGRATILGHIQRGGSPTTSDRVLATRLGVKTVELLIAGVGGQAVGIENDIITSHPIDEICKMKATSRKELYRVFEKTV